MTIAASRTADEAAKSRHSELTVTTNRGRSGPFGPDKGLFFKTWSRPDVMHPCGHSYRRDSRACRDRLSRVHQT
jgi:hypothetical protein